MSAAPRADTHEPGDQDNEDTSDLSRNLVPGSCAPIHEIEALADAIREAGGGIFA